MSTQREQIVTTMLSDPAWSWSYAELQQALPDIAPNTLRAQMSRLVKDGAVSRDVAGSLRLTSATIARNASATHTNASGTPRNERNSDPAPAGAPARTGADTDTGASVADADTGAPDASARTGRRADVLAPLHERAAYAHVLEALPIAPLRATFRLSTALAFVRSCLSDCEAPAVATCGRPGTGKTVLYRALSILLHGNPDAVMEARNLTSKQQVVGRRERKDGEWTATPSVLFEPPDRARPTFITLDEVGEKIPADVMTGFGTIIRLEPFYFLENVKMHMSALVTFSFNKPKGMTGPWTPFKWDGATRRILVCDLDHAAQHLKAGAAKAAARRVFAALEGAEIIRFEPYAARVRYPSSALLETADPILAETFRDPSELPLGDLTLKGTTTAYAALFGYPLEYALLASIADIATIVGTLPGLLHDDAEQKLNDRLRAAGLEPVVLPKVTVEAIPLEADDAMSLSPAARKRIAAHLAKASTAGVAELLTTLCEYNLARARRRWIRVPRFVLEATGRWAVAILFGVMTAVWNAALSRLLKMPRISGGAVYGVFGFAACGPATRITEYVDKDGRPLSAPRDYVIRLFGDELAPRDLEPRDDEATETTKAGFPYAA